MPVWSQGLSSPFLSPPQSPAARLGLGSARRDLPAWGRLMSAGAFCLLGAGLCIAGSRIVHCWEQGCALLGAGLCIAGSRAEQGWCCRAVRSHCMVPPGAVCEPQGGDAESKLLVWLPSELCHVSPEGFLHLRVLRL